ncbi:hypothetical protein OAA09_00705 [bacterium]|nr:hypothetical protein [bacterium]
MNIYRYYAENEETRLIFYFSYEVTKDELIQRLEDTWGSKVHVYDIFPHFNNEKQTLSDYLSIITSVGTEMFLPPGLDINIQDRVVVLFGNKTN